MNERPTLLKVLLTQRHLQKYETFRAEYERTAAGLSRGLARTPPSRAQYYRWLSGHLSGGVPYPDACRVLEGMFPPWTANELFAPCQPDQQLDDRPRVTDEHLPVAPYADVIGIFTTRAEFTSKMPPEQLLANATGVRAAGLSLNMICQHYPDQQLVRIIEAGTTLQCLFLDPGGKAIRAREREEGHRLGALSKLTELNIRMLTERVGERLSPEARTRLQLAIYDETIRFNIFLVDGRLGVIQPYLPTARGVDSPTLLVQRRDDGVGLFPIFAQVFDSLWERGKLL